jgi:diacylglycerol kinase (ATP)
MSQTKKSELARIIKAFEYSKQGLKAAYTGEPAFRDEIWGMIILLPIGLWFTTAIWEAVALIITFGLILMMELANSAIEAVVDRVGLEQHELSGRAKDIGSAGVLVALLLTGLVWAMILIPKFIN